MRFDNEDTLKVTPEGALLRLTLNRPERRNALSRGLIAALSRVFTGFDVGAEVRVVLLTGEGPVFCAGADIVEFAEAAADGQNQSDADGLAELLALMHACPLPIVASVRGAAFGGGVGLLCVADIVLAAKETRFSLSEARLGLVPATIGPYVVATLGPREARARMLLAAPFSGEEALRSGLIHRLIPPDDLETATRETVTDLLAGAPGAHVAIKRLMRLLAPPPSAATRKATTELLAARLASPEAAEGLQAFLEKRPAAWTGERG